MQKLAALSVLAFLTACGGATEPPPRNHARREVVETPTATQGEEVAVTRTGSIRRAELDVVLDGGIGRFLRRVSTEPHLEGDSFVGFRIAELRDAALFRGVDLTPGDTILAVNGHPLERPEHAVEIWNGLRVASQLVVDVMRGEGRHQLRYEIVD